MFVVACLVFADAYSEFVAACWELADVYWEPVDAYLAIADAYWEPGVALSGDSAIEHSAAMGGEHSVARLVVEQQGD